MLETLDKRSSFLVILLDTILVSIFKVRKPRIREVNGFPKATQLKLTKLFV